PLPAVEATWEAPSISLRMDVSDEALRLLRQAFDDLDAEPPRVAAAIRKAIRVARLRHDWENLVWLEEELIPRTDTETRGRVWSEVLLHTSREEAAALSRRLVEEYMSERSGRPASIDDLGGL